MTPREELIALDRDALEQQVIHLEQKLESAQFERDQELRAADHLARQLVAHREKAHGNYWCWQGDGYDCIETLAVPVLIPCKDLQDIITQRDQERARAEKAEAACAEMRHHWSIGRGRVISNFSHVPEAMRVIDWLDYEVNKTPAEECVKGWLSPEKAKLAVEALEALRDAVIKLNGCYPLEYCSEETRYRFESCQLGEKALAALKESQ